jgi:fructose-1,6-bisphosphatase I
VAAAPVNLERFILEGQHEHPRATGELSQLLMRFGTAGKRIARELALAGLSRLHGSAGSANVTGDEQKKLDVVANDILLETFDYGGLVSVAASEELDEPHVYGGSGSEGRYAILFDPLDGSSNIDVDGVLGSIFSVRRRDGGGIDSLLTSGEEQVAAGYILFGPAVVLAYSSGAAVHLFTLDPSIGEFLLTTPDVRLPRRGHGYAANEGRSASWPPGARAFVRHLQEKDPATNRPYSTRYSGSMVADFHRILLEGGIYFYPPTAARPEGKLRVLYECHPLAFLAEKAGGAASTGSRRILEIVPDSLHARTPFAIGGVEEVALYERFCREDAAV